MSNVSTTRTAGQFRRETSISPRRTMTSSETDRSIRKMRSLARSMDAAFRIPFTKRRFGFDSLIGLIPGVGDVATTVVSAMIVREAMRLGVPKRTVARMLVNIGIDALIGSVPLLGDLFDVAFKANTKNVQLLERQLSKVRAENRPNAADDFPRPFG